MTEEKKDIKLIALDMDGTLLNNELNVSEHTKEVITEALKKDIHVVLSTGRWLNSCYPYAESLELDSYLITSNGGEIWTIDKKLLDQHLLDSEKMEQMWNLGSGLGASMWMVATKEVYRNSRPEDFHEHQWLKIGFETFEESMLDELIKELSHIEGLELTNSQPMNVEVNPIGVSKAKALNFVCGELGITMNEVMAVGDSLNDIKMIQEAGVGVAMGNAQAAIKEAADFVTDTNNKDGVAKAIKRFAL